MAECGNTEEMSDSLIQRGSDVIFDIACIPCSRNGKNSEAIGYCKDGCEHLCEECIRFHKRFGMLKKHKVLDKFNMPKKQHAVPHVDTCTKRCQIHSDKIIKYFCPIDNNLGCSACVKSKHKLCEDMVQYIPEIAKCIENRHDYKEFQSKLNTLIDKSQDLIEYTTQNIEYSNDWSTRALHDIEAFRKQLNSQLDMIEEEIKSKVIEIKENNSSRLDSVIKKSSEVLKKLNGISSEFATLQKNKQLCQMFTGLKDNASQLSQLNDVLEQEHDGSMSYYTFIPNEALQTLLESIDGLGKLWLRDLEHVRVVHESEIRVGSPVVIYNDITGATLISPDKLVVADCSSKRIELIDTIEKEVTDELKLQTEPWDVAVVNGNQVAVTLPSQHCIIFLTCDFNEIVLGTYVYVHGTCRGIACYIDKLLVAFDMEKKVEILSMSGDVLRRFQTNDQGEQLFQEPTYVAFSPDGLYIYVSDWEGRSLIKIDTDGKVVSSYSDTELQEPSKVVWDKAGLIYICDRRSHNVHLLNQECRKLKLLLAKSDGMHYPSCICYCEATDQLYVGLALKYFFKVYKLSHGPWKYR